MVNFLLERMFTVFPIQNNKVIFNSFGGSGFGENPKYIALALLQETKELDLVWICKDVNVRLPKGIRVVKNHSIRAAYEMSTAKVWVNNTRHSFKTLKRKKQFYVQTWHGSMDVKKVEGQVVDKLGADYVKDAQHDGKITDLMISNGTYNSDRYHKWYWYDGPVLESGLPRMDVVINRPSNIVEKVYNYFNLEKTKKIVLYAPTFRDLTVHKNDPLWQYRFDYKKILNALRQKFDGEFQLLVRLHPNISNQSSSLNLGDAMDATSYDDMQELLAASEVLITDYSSCMFDFILAQKPVFLLAKDYLDYINVERGLNFELKELPPSFSENEKELMSNIEHFNLDKYQLSCKKMMEKLGIFETGHASEEVAKKILQIINATN